MISDAVACGEILDGKYHLDRILGQGGMGIVYEATHTKIGRRVAIKVLRGRYAEDDMAIRRFHQEAKLAGSIGHDNICEVTDLGMSEGGIPYLVMPLLKGISFVDLLKRSTGLSPRRLVDIVAQTLSALEAAHDHGIVHRDLKPDNIFISRFGDRDDFVKLLDFGISKIVSGGTWESGDLTQTGTILGTPHYMSPEQAKGSKAIDHRVDIYSMGVILYEAFTHQKPFGGDSYNEVIFKILSAPYPAPRAVNGAISPMLERVILKSMSRDPVGRYPSAGAMRDDLLAVLEMDSTISDVSSIPKSMEVTQQASSVPRVVGNADSSRSSSVSASEKRKSGQMFDDEFHSTLDSLRRLSGSQPTGGLDTISLSERESWVQYEGKRILVRDYTLLSNVEAARIIDQCINTTNQLIDMGAKDLLILSDITDGFADKETISNLKRSGRMLRPITKKVAIVGAVGIQKYLLHAINTVSSLGGRAFDNREEAMAWLVED